MALSSRRRRSYRGSCRRNLPAPRVRNLRRTGRALGDYDPVRADTVGSAALLLLQTMVWREPASRRTRAEHRTYRTWSIISVRRPKDGTAARP